MGHGKEIAVEGETEPVVVTLGVGLTNTKSRRDHRTADQLDALRKLGIDWAQWSVAHLPEIARERHLGPSRERLSRAFDGTLAWLRSQQPPRQDGGLVQAVHTTTRDLIT
ncbi:hypothetical protein ACFQ7B_29275 [Streptomyces erythrochromogenes]|uniref:hypothetical protein n=1 Tax=Streptomyces erythrochromogenes TaxID=285574 RepID=UPI0036A9F69D